MLLSRLASLLRRTLHRPDVIVDFLYEDGLFFVTVANIGSAPAHHVHVAFDPPLRGVAGTVTISDLALFQRLTFLAPHKEIRAFVDVARAYFQREEPPRITADVRFRSEHGTSYQRSITHDLSIYRELGDTRLVRPGSDAALREAAPRPIPPS